MVRAVVSDQLRSSADAVASNLFEARLHEIDFAALISSDGIGLAASVEEHLADARRDMHLTGFFQAFGSTLDCLAATALAVLRAPRSLQKADFNDLLRLEKTVGVSQQHLDQMQRLRSLIDEHRVGPPSDWLEWSLEFRNALLHRARHFSFNWQRPRKTDIEIVSDEFPYWILRFDPHLVRRPWLPDMVLLPGSGAVAEAILEEPASTTLRGLIQSLNALVEAVAAFLLMTWEGVAEGSLTLASPPAAWNPAWNYGLLHFPGYAPEPRSANTMMASSADAKRLSLAAQVRERALSEPSADGGAQEDGDFAG